MSKYIRLDEATDLFRGIDATMVGSFVADTLESLPTIDIVRCEECEHWDDRRKDAWWSNEGACKRTSRLGDATYRNHDDFCSYGERIEE